VSHEIATKIMVVNKEGDLELYKIHDAPKQTVWSPRGDLAISGGDGFKVVSPSQESEAGDDSKDKETDKRPASTTRRGRAEDGVTQPTTRPPFSRNVSSSYVPSKDLGAIPVAAHKKAQEVRKAEAKKKEEIAVRVVEEDVSIVMKKRALMGYGIGNVSVCDGYWTR
jgi:hypothetical protein